MSQGRLTLLALLSLLAPAAPVPRSGDLGREWIARDWTPNYSFSGKWIRRGQSALFDVYYKDFKGNSFKWTVEVTSISGASFTGAASMPMNEGTRVFPLSGRIAEDGRTIRGKGSWCAPGVNCGFELKTDWQLAPVSSARPRNSAPTQSPSLPTTAPASPLRASPGTLWKVRDRTTPGYDYSGTWTFDQGKIHFKYKGANAALAEGVLWLRAFTGSTIRIYNSGARRYYEGTISPDGRSVKGTSTGCPPTARCVWEATIEK